MLLKKKSASVIVVRPPALPLIGNNSILKNRTVSWCLPGNLGCLFDFLIRSSQPDENPKKFRLLKTLFAVFLVATAAAQTPPPDQARQTEVQKEKERECFRQSAARSAPVKIIGFPTLTPFYPVRIDADLITPVHAVLKTEGEILPDHSFSGGLRGSCKVEPHKMFSSQDIRIEILPGL